MRGKWFGPLRLDLRDVAAPQPGGLDKLACHHPGWPLLRQGGPGPERELRAARAYVLPLLGVPQADVGQQAREQGDMNELRVGRRTPPRSLVAHQRAQLPDQVLPLPDAQVVEELPLAETTKRVRGQRLLLLVDVVPEVEVGQEVRRLVAEAAVLLISSLLVFHRSFPRVLDR